MKIGVVGAGSWGTAISHLLAKKGEEVRLWARRSEIAQHINEVRHNPIYLTEKELARGLLASNSIREVIEEADLVILAVPSHALRDVVRQIKPFFKSSAPVLSLTKGIEEGSGLRMSQVIKEELGEAALVAVLSGPNHAEEVIEEIPSATVVAGYDEALLENLQKVLITDYFRVYTNSDLIGVEVGGATKNIVALASGISDGLGYGDNTKASLMTRGLAEMVRLGVALGADPLTFLGLSGVGDLIATCTSLHSRNRQVGEQIGRGKSLEEVLNSMTMVAEGVRTTRAVYNLARRLGVDMPITDEVYQVLYGGKEPRETVMELMLRAPKSEVKPLLEEGNKTRTT
jgi:glycerol-3-phosphate dehydrogenase (NAD(P)+)